MNYLTIGRLTDLQKRFILFLGGCIPFRIALAYLSKIANPTQLQILGTITLFPAFGFLLIYFLNLRSTGAEVFGEKIWWNHLRPIHGIIYLIFSILALQKSKDAWKLLALDVLIGLLAFIHHHCI